jgi:hypothetical protein
MHRSRTRQKTNKQKTNKQKPKSKSLREENLPANTFQFAKKLYARILRAGWPAPSEPSGERLHETQTKTLFAKNFSN